MDLEFIRPDELLQMLGERLRKERLAQHITQADLAARAGVGVNTLSNLEAGRNTAFDVVVRVAMALGRRDELEALFKPRLNSLEDIRRYEVAAQRARVRRGVPDA